MTLFPTETSLLELVQMAATSAVFCVAIWAIFVNRRSQREQTARNAYLKDLELAIANPAFAFPNWNEVDLDNERFGSSQDESKRKEMFERYEWFVSFLMNTASLIWNAVPTTHILAKLMKLQIEYHWKYFDRFKENRRFLTLWYEIYRSQIDDAIQKGRDYKKPEVLETVLA